MAIFLPIEDFKNELIGEMFFNLAKVLHNTLSGNRFQYKFLLFRIFINKTCDLGCFN